MDLPPLAWLILGAAGGALIAACILWVYFRVRLIALIAAARKQGVDQSRSVLKGKIAEQIAPLLRDFPYLPSDARFLGDPVDYVIFNGYSAVKDDAADADDLEVVILDIKHGQARLSPPQKAIAAAIAAGRVRFETLHISEAGDIRAR